jgi:hypothetical protein
MPGRWPRAMSSMLPLPLMATIAPLVLVVACASSTSTAADNGASSGVPISPVLSRAAPSRQSKNMHAFLSRKPLLKTFCLVGKRQLWPGERLMSV